MIAPKLYWELYQECVFIRTENKKLLLQHLIRCQEGTMTCICFIFQSEHNVVVVIVW